MAEKVKVSREVGRALESAFKMYDHEEERENAILKHTTRGTWSGKREILHEIEPLELAKILINGYEIEETPEGKLAHFYRELKTKNASTFEQYDSNPFENGIIRGIEETIRFLCLEIEGINK